MEVRPRGFTLEGKLTGCLGIFIPFLMALLHEAECFPQAWWHAPTG